VVLAWQFTDENVSQVNSATEMWHIRFGNGLSDCLTVDLVLFVLSTEVLLNVLIFAQLHRSLYLVHVYHCYITTPALSASEIIDRPFSLRAQHNSLSLFTRRLNHRDGNSITMVL
jgi:hypothetical protein